MQGFETFPVTKQITFHKLLVDARGKWLVDALRDVVRDIDPSALKEQLVEYVPRAVGRIRTSRRTTNPCRQWYQR